MKSYIHEQAERLVSRFGTRDPFRILEELHIVLLESDRYRNLKGYCFRSCRTTYIVINTYLPEAEKRIVAAHELGHAILHKRELELAPMKDHVLYDMTSKAEHEANLFAADLLIADSDLEELASDSELDYFGLCSMLNTTPDLMSFKLFSLVRRGFSYNLPLSPDSRFLGRSEHTSPFDSEPIE